MVAPVVHYRDIPGFPGYRAGDDGSVWSRWTCRAGAGWKRRKLGSDRKGYLTVNLRTAEGKRRLMFVHRLVLLAFAGPPPEGCTDGCHKDGDPANNTPGNLRWGTRAENRADSRGHGTEVRGSQSHFAKLDEGRVGEMLRRIFGGELTQAQAARAYRVSDATVSKIVTGKKWRHVPRPTQTAA